MLGAWCLVLGTGILLARLGWREMTYKLKYWMKSRLMFRLWMPPANIPPECKRNERGDEGDVNVKIEIRFAAGLHCGELARCHDLEVDVAY